MGALIGLLGALLASTVTGAESAAPAIINVRINDQRLTIDAREAPLAEVLRAIGELADIDVTLRGDVGTMVSESFAGVPLEEGLRRLARGHSVVVMYAVPEGGADHERLTAIWVTAPMAGSATVSADAPAPRSQRRTDPETGDVSASRAVTEPVAEKRGDADAAAVSLAVAWTREIQSLADEAELGNELAATRLMEISASEPDAALRAQAVAALGRLPASIAAEPALTDALADHDAEVRLRAVRGLRVSGTDSAAQSLAAVVARDADPRVRLAALAALTSLPSRAMFGGLHRASRDPDEVVRTVAIRGLAWWSVRAPVSP